MLKENLLKVIEQQPIELYEEQLAFLERQNAIENKDNIIIKDPKERFQDALMERCEKETVELIVVEAPIFFNEKIEHFKVRSNEFLYVEANQLSLLGVDGLSLEVDDVFGTHTALFGLQLKKLYRQAIIDFLDANLKDEVGKYSIEFSGQDGLWNINFALNYVDGFKEDMTIGEAYELMYQTIFKLVSSIEEAA